MSDGWSRDIEHLEELLGPRILEMLNGDGSRTTDVFVNPDGEWWSETDKVRAPLGMKMPRNHVRQVINMAANYGGMVVNRDNPIVETQLPWGQRFHGIIEPIARRGPTFVIRVPRRESFPLQGYVDKGQMDSDAFWVIERALRDRLNMVVFGVTGSGKTTFLDSLCGHPTVTSQRMVSIEGTSELKLEHVPDKAQLVVDPRTPHEEHVRAMRRLVSTSLRMRPDRIIIGEARGGEILEWVNAMYTGHGGGLLTMHADNPRDCMRRLELMLAHEVADSRAFRQVLVSLVHVMVWMRHDPEVGWRVAGVYRPLRFDGARENYEIDTLSGIHIEN